MATQNQMAQPRRGRGCLGCLLWIIGIAAVLAAAWFLLPRLLEATGVLPPDAEDLYSGAPDPVAGEQVEALLREGGIEGARVAVIPIQGSDGQLAVITLDQSAVIRRQGNETAEEAFRSTLRGLSQASDAGLRLERTVIDIRGESGEPFLVFTAPQSAIAAYANGQIDQREFVRAVDADLSSLLDLVDVQALVQGE